MSVCGKRKEGDDTGGYIAIFDLFEMMLSMMTPAYSAYKTKCETLLKAARNYSETVSACTPCYDVIVDG